MATKLADEKTWVTLTGLPGCKKQRQAVHVRSVTDAMNCARYGLSITTEGSNGAISVWVTDDGRRLGEFMRHRFTVDEQEFPTLKSLRAWLKRWWPELGRN